MQTHNWSKLLVIYTQCHRVYLWVDHLYQPPTIQSSDGRGRQMGRRALKCWALDITLFLYASTQQLCFSAQDQATRTSSMDGRRISEVLPLLEGLISGYWRLMKKSCFLLGMWPMLSFSCPSKLPHTLGNMGSITRTLDILTTKKEDVKFGGRWDEGNSRSWRSCCK